MLADGGIVHRTCWKPAQLGRRSLLCDQAGSAWRAGAEQRGGPVTRFAARLSDTEARWAANVRQRDDARTQAMYAAIVWMFIEAVAVSVFLGSFR